MGAGHAGSSPSRAQVVAEPSLGPLAAATALAAFVSGFLCGSVGGGIGLALTPVLTLALPAQSAFGLTRFVLILADPIILRYYWRQWDAPAPLPAAPHHR